MVFHLLCKDNDSYMTGSCDRVDPASGAAICSTCGFRTNPDHTSSGFRLRRRQFDISCCYDGAIIVSSRFRGWYLDQGGRNMRFVDLPGAPGFHHLGCIQPVALDYAAMQTRRQRLCSGCGRYLDVTVAAAPVLAPDSTLADNEMAFSDWWFGSNNEASPLILCGAGLASVLRTARCTGIDAWEAVAA